MKACTESTVVRETFVADGRLSEASTRLDSEMLRFPWPGESCEIRRSTPNRFQFRAPPEQAAAPDPNDPRFVAKGTTD